jgi:epoxyqueuosine reductase
MSDQKILTKSATVQDLLPKLDVDALAVASWDDLEGTKLQKTALYLLPEAHSVVVFAMEVYPEILNHARPERTTGLASLNDLLDRHNEFLNGRLTKAAYDVAKVSHRNGLKALPLPAVGCPLDTRFLEAVFSYKHAGQAARLGRIGRSSLLITQRFGPRVRLSCCLTEAVLESLEPTEMAMVSVCEGCDICINNCPAKALSSPQAAGPYAINKFACSSFRNASGGCSECMRLCPVGRS